MAFREAKHASRDAKRAAPLTCTLWAFHIRIPREAHKYEAGRHAVRRQEM